MHYCLLYCVGKMSLLYVIKEYFCTFSKVKEFLKPEINSMKIYIMIFICILVFFLEADALEWICKDSGPCVHITNPPNGIGYASKQDTRYRLEIQINKRENGNKHISQWSVQQRKFDVLIKWYRLVDVHVQLPIPACRNSLSCAVSLIDEQHVLLSHDPRNRRRRYEYRHYLVEVRFGGHSASTSGEIIIRRNLESDQELAQDYIGDHHGINQGQGDLQEADVGIYHDVMHNYPYDEVYDDGFDSGKIAGLIISITAIILVLYLFFCCCWRRNRFRWFRRKWKRVFGQKKSCRYCQGSYGIDCISEWSSSSSDTESSSAFFNPNPCPACSGATRHPQRVSKSRKKRNSSGHRKNRKSVRISTFMNDDEPYPMYEEGGYCYKCYAIIWRLFRSCIDCLASIKWWLEPCLETLESCFRSCLNMCSSCFTSLCSIFVNINPSKKASSEESIDSKNTEVYANRLSSKANRLPRKKRKKKNRKSKTHKHSFLPKIMKLDKKRQSKRKPSPSAGLTVTKQPLFSSKNVDNEKIIVNHLLAENQNVSSKLKEWISSYSVTTNPSQIKESPYYESILDPPSCYLTAQCSESNSTQSRLLSGNENSDCTFVPKSSDSSLINYEYLTSASTSATSAISDHVPRLFLQKPAKTAQVMYIDEKFSTPAKSRAVKALARSSQGKSSAELLQSAVNAFMYSDDGTMSTEDNYYENFWPLLPQCKA